MAGWIGAAITAVGGIVGGSLNLAGTKNTNKTALELQKNERRQPLMILGQEEDGSGVNPWFIGLGILVLVIIIVLIVLLVRK